MAIDLVTFPDVDIMAEGTYPCETGVHTFTREDLESAVAAVSSDAAVKDPRLKIGHAGKHGEPNIGAPVFGRYTNMRVVAAEDGKAKIIGDVVGVPTWFAQIMPTAYPNRSIEGKWDVETSTGNKHKFVIQAVSCLGVDLPAIDTLEDLQTVFERGPDGLETEVVAQYRGDKPVTEYTNRATAREMEVQAMKPEQVQRLRALAGMTEEQLPDDASEEQIAAAVDAIEQRVTPESEETSEEETSQLGNTHEESSTEETPEPEPVAAGESDNVTIPRATLVKLQEGAEAGAEAKARQDNDRRHNKVEAAIHGGKIPPSARAHYRGLMGKDEKGTSEFLDSLEENIIPVKAQEKGETNDSESAVASAQEQSIRAWFPELSVQGKETV